MPRQSAASMAVVRVDGPRAARLTPTRQLSAEAREVFEAITGSVDPAHFVASDQVLLEAYAEAIVIGRRAAQAMRNGDRRALNEWSHAVRAIASLSARLRLAPSAREHPRTTGRRATTPFSAYAVMGDDA